MKSLCPGGRRLTDSPGQSVGHGHHARTQSKPFVIPQMSIRGRQRVTLGARGVGGTGGVEILQILQNMAAADQTRFMMLLSVCLIHACSGGHTGRI